MSRRRQQLQLDKETNKYLLVESKGSEEIKDRKGTCHLHIMTQTNDQRQGSDPTIQHRYTLI